MKRTTRPGEFESKLSVALGASGARLRKRSSTRMHLSERRTANRTTRPRSALGATRNGPCLARQRTSCRNTHGRKCRRVGRSGANPREGTIKTAPPAPMSPVSWRRVRSGSRRDFTSENHLLAPLWFALKSLLLRQFFRQYGVPFRPTRRLDRLSASLSNLRRSTKRLCNDERWYRSSGILKTGALLHQTPPGEWYENQNFPGAFAPKPSNR